MIQDKGDIVVAKIFLEGVEMIPAIIAKKLDYGRGFCDDPFTGFHLAIKDPQRVGLRPSSAVRTEGVGFLGQVVLQRLPERLPAIRAPKGVQMEGEVRQSHDLEQTHDHYDKIGIRFRTRVAKDLGVYLMKLPKPPFLGPFMSKHGADGKELLDRVLLIKPVLNVGPHNRRRRLRSKGHAVSLTVGE